MNLRTQHTVAARELNWTRREFVAASGAAALVGPAAAPLLGAEATATADSRETIDFPASYLYCAPTNSGIWVRVQAECRGTLTDLGSGKSDEYVMGVVAKTGLTPDARTGQLAPGYDYWIIFSKTHVFTKRAHSSAYLNNPTVLEHKEFGEANWRLSRVRSRPLLSPAEIRKALENWRRICARTAFTSSDGAREFTLDYPVKWADYSLDGKGFRVETGPVFLLDPDRLWVGSIPKFEDFQWAHLDYHTFNSARLLLERPTSVLADATFTPPSENGRENRRNPGLTDAQVKEIEEALNSRDISLPRETVSSLLSTDHYSQAKDVTVVNELFVLTD